VATISEFKRLRIGSNFPATLDISPIDGHESDGLYAQGNYRRERDNHGSFFQVRRHNRYDLMALFAFSTDKIDVPNFWRNSKVVWDSRDED